MKKFFIIFAALCFIVMNLTACGESKPAAGSKSDRGKSDWSAQSAVDDIEAMKKAAEKGNAPEPAGAEKK